MVKARQIKKMSGIRKRELVKQAGQGYNKMRSTYYIDKTMFIKELLDLKRKVNLFTRPRRL